MDFYLEIERDWKLDFVKSKVVEKIMVSGIMTGY